jgi:hypothetical protein
MRYLPLAEYAVTQVGSGPDSDYEIRPAAAWCIVTVLLPILS